MSVTAAQGFRAAGVRAGLRAHGERPDVALVVNDGPTQVAAGVFTRNQVKAAPVLWSQQVLVEHDLRAVVLNAGGANACTGPDGFGDTHRTAEKVADVLGCGAIEVAVCSTGLIGERLPMEKLLAGVDAAAAELADGEEAGTGAATAVLTTDTVDKQAARTRHGWTVGGFAKGAGMMAPSLATMLVVVTTDAVVDAATADAALRAATSTTFDRLDIDGATSTNDTVLLLASGASGVEADAGAFTEVLTEVCDELAQGLQADAEGVTKRIAVTVTGRPRRPRRPARRAHDRPRQPGEDRALRLRPELGPDRRRGRRERGVRRPAEPERHRQRRAAVRGRRGRRRSLEGRPLRPGGHRRRRPRAGRRAGHRAHHRPVARVRRGEQRVFIMILAST